MNRFGIVGCGSLGKTLTMHLWKAYPAKFVVSCRNQEKLKSWFLSETSPKLYDSVQITNDSAIVAQEPQVFLCVKPSQAKELCLTIRGSIKPDSVVVSTMAAIQLNYLQEWLQHKTVVRIMPTIAENGPICVYNPENHPMMLPNQNQILFKDESEFDSTVGISGCAPGLMSFVLQQWIDAVENMGFNRSIAERLILDNFRALGEMNPKTIEDLQKIQSYVSSPGGATEKGVDILTQHRLSEVFTEMLSEIEDRLDSIKPHE